MLELLIGEKALAVVMLPPLSLEVLAMNPAAEAKEIHSSFCSIKPSGDAGGAGPEEEEDEALAGVPLRVPALDLGMVTRLVLSLSVLFLPVVSPLS